MHDPIIGLFLAALASCCFAGGTILQAVEARAVGREHALRASLLVALARRRRWLAGIALGVAAAGLQIAALSLAPVAMVQPADAFGFVVLLVAGSRLLGERVGRRQLTAIGAILAGVAGVAFADIAYSGTHAGAGELALALGLTGVLAAAPFALRQVRPVPTALIIVGAGAAFGLAAFGLRLVADALAAGDWAVVVVVGAVAASGSLLGLASEMSALQLRAVGAVAPVIFALELLIPVVLARLVGGERWPTDVGHVALLAGGMALTLAGTTALLQTGVVGAVLHAGESPDHD